MPKTKKDAKSRQKEREKERKKRGTRKYGQAEFKHSRMGVYSCIFAAVSFAIIVGCIFFAFVKRGETIGILGGVAIMSVLLSGFGVRAGIKGLKEREKRYVTCKVGIVVNSLILLGLVFIFLGGLL